MSTVVQKPEHSRQQAEEWVALKFSGPMNEKDSARLRDWLAESEWNRKSYFRLLRVLRWLDVFAKKYLADEYQVELQEEAARN